MDTIKQLAFYWNKLSLHNLCFDSNGSKRSSQDIARRKKLYLGKIKVLEKQLGKSYQIFHLSQS